MTKFRVLGKNVLREDSKFKTKRNKIFQYVKSFAFMTLHPKVRNR